MKKTDLISVAEAKRLILENSLALNPVKLSLEEAAGLAIAEDVRASIDIPSFDQSSMDGYAFFFEDLQDNKTIKIKGEVAAGNTEGLALSTGTAARIFTGAAVPAGADTVVMQEKTKVERDILFIEDENIQKGSNVRIKSSEIKAGELAIPKETILSAPAIGFLASLGITDVMVYPLPVVSIIVTGNELQSPGKPLEFGQVYESNSWSLRAALKQMHITNVKLFRAEDKLETVAQIIQEALQQSDIIFLTGGVSVGDYDFVTTAADQIGIQKIFHKIKQKPGKPFYFGKKDVKLIFGLPGNPASVLTCFYQYADPALRKIARQNTGLKVLQAPLSTSFKKTAGLTHFLKGFYDGKTVTPLTAQESYRLSSFAGANCLVQINEDSTQIAAGEMVEIHLLPE